MRVGFLFNHYGTHQVPHAAPFAFELSRERPDIEVVIAHATDAERRTAEEIGSLFPGHRCTYHHLGTPRLYRWVDPLVSRWGFLRKDVSLWWNLDFFRGLDGIVAPERHCMRLRTRHELPLALIHTRHGAGDRQGSFDARSGEFDFTLLPGRKYVDRLSERGFLRAGTYAEVGWVKFEVAAGLRRPRFDPFEKDRPVVVYNPHFDPSISSWSTMGIEVLEYFANQSDYNLIFAPHLVLFLRAARQSTALPDRYRDHPHIFIDTGSEASADMTYMRAADLYLGDVSSQVYEFLLEPRPCVFLNGHGVDWKDDPYYTHWHLGPVVEDVPAELGSALERGFGGHADYVERQREAFEYTFHSPAGSTAAQRGAQAIAGFLDRRTRS